MEYYRYIVEYLRNNPKGSQEGLYKWFKLKNIKYDNFIKELDIFDEIKKNYELYNKKVELMESIESKIN
jgi:hypothetical protein